MERNLKESLKRSAEYVTRYVDPKSNKTIRVRVDTNNGLDQTTPIDAEINEDDLVAFLEGNNSHIAEELATPTHEEEVIYAIKQIVNEPKVAEVLAEFENWDKDNDVIEKVAQLVTKTYGIHPDETKYYIKKGIKWTS